MGWEFRTIVLLPLLATGINCALAYYAWRRRETAVYVLDFDGSRVVQLDKDGQLQAVYQTSLGTTLTLASSMWAK